MWEGLLMTGTEAEKAAPGGWGWGGLGRLALAVEGVFSLTPLPQEGLVWPRVPQGHW